MDCLVSRRRSEASNWKKGHWSQGGQQLEGVGSGNQLLGQDLEGCGNMCMCESVSLLTNSCSHQQNQRNRIWLPVVFMSVSVLLVFLCVPVKTLVSVHVSLCEQPYMCMYILASSEYMLSLAISWTYKWEQQEKFLGS